MFIVIHGDDVEESANTEQEIIEKFKSKNYFIQRLPDIPGFLEKTLTETSLFEDKILIVLNSIKSLTKKELELIKTKNYSEFTSILYKEDKLLTMIQIKSLGKIDKVYSSTYPKYLWKFLDSFYPGNTKICLKLLNEVANTEALELVLYMLVKHLNELYVVKNNSDKVDSLPTWKTGKLKTIASKFNDGDIEEIISTLAEIDIKTKTTDAQIKPLLDFLVISKLK